MWQNVHNINLKSYSHGDQHKEQGQVGPYRHLEALHVIGQMADNHRQHNRQKVVDQRAHEVPGHWRRIKTEEKAKVVSAVWGTGLDSIPCRTSYFAPGWFEEKDE